MENQSRNSRWVRHPVLDDQHQPQIARIGQRDVEILTLLARYRYLPADYIHAFLGGGLTPLLRRLNLLFRQPNLYINRPQQQRQNASANFRSLIYELDERGIEVLAHQGVQTQRRKYRQNFVHELMVCQIMASIELGALYEQNLRLISWQEILASEKTPLNTRSSPNPAAIPVSFPLRGGHCDTVIVADGHPFGIERTVDGQRTYLFFPGIEADCGTEPVESNDAERSSIYKKFAAYRAIAAQEIYRSHFGFPNFLVPIITTSQTRMRAMMKLLERMTEGRGSKMFLFKHFPALTSTENPPTASGHMLTAPWDRVGFDPIKLTG